MYVLYCTVCHLHKNPCNGFRTYIFIRFSGRHKVGRQDRPKDGKDGIIPAGIHIIQIAADAVIVPVQGKGLPDISQVAVLREEVCRHYIVVPCPQVLAVDVGVVAFPVVGVLVLMGGGAVGKLPCDAVAVGFGQMAFCVGQACHASPGVVEIVGGPAGLVKELFADPVHTVGVRCVRPAVDVQLHQDFRVLPVHVVDVLYELILAGEDCSCWGNELDQLFLRGAYLPGYFQLDSRAVVVAVVVGIVVAGEILVLLRVVVHLVDAVPVPVVGRRHLQVPVVGVPCVHCLQAVLHGVPVGYEAVVGGAVLFNQVAVAVVGVADLSPGSSIAEHRFRELVAVCILKYS